MKAPLVMMSLQQSVQLSCIVFVALHLVYEMEHTVPADGIAMFEYIFSL